MCWQEMQTRGKGQGWWTVTVLKKFIVQLKNNNKQKEKKKQKKNQKEKINDKKVYSAGRI